MTTYGLDYSAHMGRLAGEVVTASYMNTHLRDNLNAELPASASVATDESTTSTSYAALATAGPAVTITTGTKALVSLHASSYCGSASVQYASFAVSGATTLAAADARAARDATETVSQFGVCSRMFLLTGLTAGSNTFTMQYRTTAGTANFSNRDITVWSYNS